MRVAARSEEEARSIGTTQAVIPVELHAVKNGYGPLTAGAPSPLRIQAWPDAVIDRIGHLPTSAYFEWLWLPRIGRSTAWRTGA